MSKYKSDNFGTAVYGISEERCEEINGSIVDPLAEKDRSNDQRYDWVELHDTLVQSVYTDPNELLYATFVFGGMKFAIQSKHVQGMRSTIERMMGGDSNVRSIELPPDLSRMLLAGLMRRGKGGKPRRSFPDHFNDGDDE